MTNIKIYEINNYEQIELKVITDQLTSKYRISEIEAEPLDKYTIKMTITILNNKIDVNISREMLSKMFDCQYFIYSILRGTNYQELPPPPPAPPPDDPPPPLPLDDGLELIALLEDLIVSFINEPNLCILK